MKDQSQKSECKGCKGKRYIFNSKGHFQYCLICPPLKYDCCGKNASGYHDMDCPKCQPSQKEGEVCSHVGGGEWSVKGGKSYAICQKCGEEYRTSLLNVLECEEPQPEPEKENELLENWKDAYWKLNEADDDSYSIDLGVIPNFIETLLAAQAKKSFKEGAESQKDR